MARPYAHLDRLHHAKGLALGHLRANLGQLDVDHVAQLALHLAIQERGASAGPQAVPWPTRALRRCIYLGKVADAHGGDIAINLGVLVALGVLEPIRHCKHSHRRDPYQLAVA